MRKMNDDYEKVMLVVIAKNMLLATWVRVMTMIIQVMVTVMVMIMMDDV